MSQIQIIGKSVRVVDAPNLKIDELTGNVATQSDNISIAYVTADAGTAEPWLTLHYDEYICVRTGQVNFEWEDANTGSQKLEVFAGQTVFIADGTRFRPSFPVDAEYIPVCLPAFRPDRCFREDRDMENQEIGNNLKKLHAKQEDRKTKKSQAANILQAEILYHMTTKKEWEAAVQSNSAYYPKTFYQDGNYTHATAVPDRLIETANHFYQDVAGEWICLEFKRSELKRRGIVVKDEAAMDVGQKKIDDSWEDTHRNWICPHVYGGLPIEVVHKTYEMVRDGSKFVGIRGL